MNSLSRTLARGIKFYGPILLVLLAFVLLADLNAKHILLFSLKYPGIDKVAHFIVHNVVVIWLYQLGRFLWPEHGRFRSLLQAFVLSVVLGSLDETQQMFVDGRDVDLYDVLANICGSLSAIILISLRNLKKGRLLFALWLVVPLGGLYQLVLHTQVTSLYYNAGLMYIKDKNYPAARQAFLSAIDHGEKLPALFNELAWLELEHLDTDPARSLEYSRQAVVAQPGNADFLDTHGWALYMNGRYLEALKYLQASYNAKAQGYCINFHLAATLHALGRNREARTYLQAQLALNKVDRFAEKSRKLLEVIN